MRIGRMVMRGGLAGMAVVALGLGPGAAPASAECVYAEFYVTRANDTPIWVVGENDPCLYPTPWTWGILLPGDSTQGGLPDGTPNGYHRDIRVPLPV